MAETVAEEGTEELAATVKAAIKGLHQLSIVSVVLGMAGVEGRQAKEGKVVMPLQAATQQTSI